jgi:hypothetical protein
MRLAGGTKITFHAQMQFDSAVFEPDAAAFGKLGRLGYLGEAGVSWLKFL